MLAQYFDSQYDEYDSADGLHGKPELASHKTPYETTSEGKHEGGKSDSKQRKGQLLYGAYAYTCE